MTSFSLFVALPLELQLRIFEWATDHPFQQSFYVNWAARGKAPSPMKHPMLRVSKALRAALLDHIWSTKRVIVPQRQHTFDAFTRSVGCDSLARVHRLEAHIPIVMPSHKPRVATHAMLQQFPALTHLHLLIEPDRQDHVESKCPIINQETYSELLIDVLRVKLQEVAQYNARLHVTMGFPRKPACCKPAALQTGLDQRLTDMWGDLKLV